MKIMTAAATVAFLASAPVWAEQTAGEKVDETVNSTKSTGKKAAHRVSETACTGTKAECANSKAKNRVDESKDSAADKTKEGKDKVD